MAQQRHQLFAHASKPSPIDVGELQECPECSKKYTKKTNLYRHMKVAHNSVSQPLTVHSNLLLEMHSLSSQQKPAKGGSKPVEDVAAVVPSEAINEREQMDVPPVERPDSIDQAQSFERPSLIDQAFTQVINYMKSQSVRSQFSFQAFETYDGEALRMEFGFMQNVSDLCRMYHCFQFTLRIFSLMVVVPVNCQSMNCPATYLMSPLSSSL